MLVRQIPHYCRALPEEDGLPSWSILVDCGGNPRVRIHLDEAAGKLLLFHDIDGVRVVWNAQFFAEDSELLAVWSGERVQLERRIPVW